MNADEVFMMLITNTMGESILVETLRSAAYYYTRSCSSFKPRHHVTKAQLQEARYCYYFVQGTGLDLLMKKYHLDYDPDELRNGFNYCLRHAS